MSQHRGPLLLILLTVLFVTGGYASPIRKSTNHDFGFHTAIYTSTSSDNWLGGAGNWSDSWCWGSGLPSGGSDVVISSGRDDDLVYLDTSASIASLTLGGDPGGAQLVDNGTAQSLTISGALTVNDSGTLHLAAGNTVNVGADSSNAGAIELEHGGTLRVNGVMNNSSWLSVEGGSQAQFGTLVNTGYMEIYGSTLMVAGDIQNAGLDGAGMVVGDAQIRVGGALINSAWFTTGGKVVVNGDVVNTGFGMMFLHGQLSVTGNVSNSAWIEIGKGGPGHATFGSLDNSGQIYTFNPSGFSVVGNATNSGMIMDWDPDYGGRAFSIGANLNNSGTIDTGFDVRGNVTNSGSIGVTDAEIGGNLANSGTFGVGDWAPPFDNANLAIHGNVDNSGGFYLADGSTTNIDGRLTNTTSGVLTLSHYRSDALILLNVGKVVNQGTVTLYSETVMNVTGGAHAVGSALSGFLNTGIVNIGQNSTLNVVGNNYTQLAGQTTINGTLQVQARGMANFAGGSVFGNGGTISAPVFSNAAINIGQQLMSIGQFAMLGNYTQGPNGSLTFDIAGTAPGEYDQLSIAGHAQFNGLMTVDLIHGFVPDLGDAFDIVHFASKSGTFSLVAGLPINGEEHFVLEYNATDLTLDVVSGALSEANGGQPILLASSTATDNTFNLGMDRRSRTTSSIASDYGRSSPTPEPGSLLLLGSGLLCVGYSVRRRMTK